MPTAKLSGAVDPAVGRSPIVPGSSGLCALGLLLVAALCFAAAGCQRSHYRHRADQEAYALVREKANDPRWALERISIETDPRSRMFDPFNPDRPPMPPDDPASHDLMHEVDGKRGYPYWHVNGETPFVENPAWQDCLLLDEDGALRLDARTSVVLALLHSPDFQKEFEDLYLAALDVSAERFRFDSQFFGGYSVEYTADGPERPGATKSTSVLGLSTFSTGRRPIVWQKAFTTGADLVVGLANSLVWDFSGPNNHSAFTLLDFAMVQPLLRGAGRDRILETLTRAERALLANVRQIERFRRGFFMQVVTGTGEQAGVSRAGGVFGETGLAGFTGLGAGGFGSVGVAAGGQTGGIGFGGGAGADRAGGFMGLLQVQQDIRIQQANITGLRSNLAQLTEVLNEGLTRIPENPDEIVRQRLQVAQARQALYNAEGVLLNTQNEYQTSLDRFKVGLGLPPYLCVKIEDPMLEPFELIDPSILPLENEVSTLRRTAGETNQQILRSVQYEEKEDVRTPSLAWNQELASALRRQRAVGGRIRTICGQLSTVNLGLAQADIERLKTALPQRREQLIRLGEKYSDEMDRRQLLEVMCQRRLPVDVNPTVLDVERLATLPEQLDTEYARLQQRFASYQEPLDALETRINDLLETEVKPPPQELYKLLETDMIFAVPGLLSDLAADLLDLQLLQARARTDSISLKPVELSAQDALAVAEQCRRDWMNRRARLVDAWRLIEFNADNLESALDVVFSGDIGNTGDNPLRLRSTTGRLRVGLQWDAPITRLRERNTYRQSLIEYQQARRSYYRYVDSVSRQLRETLRTIELNQMNFEARRIAVLAAVDQVILTDEIQKLTEQLGQASGATAARDVVSALSDLQRAQRDFLSVWVNYEVLRRLLDLDLGTMRLDSEGVWRDPDAIGPRYGYPSQEIWEECWPEELPEDLPPTRLPPPGETIPVPPPIAPGDPVDGQVDSGQNFQLSAALN